MKRLVTIALALIGVLVLVPSCEKAPFVTMTGPRSYTFTRDGGTQSFTFTCNRDWSVSSSESWIRVSPSSGAKGDNEVTVTITCLANTTYDPRNATITVRVEELTETISVTQETGIGLIVSPTTFDLTNAAQDIEIEVQKNVKYAVTIDEASKSWITQKGTKALSSERVTFSIAANESYDDREGKITFKQTDGELVQTVTVKQSQTNGLFITTSTYDLSNEAHTLSVEVKANVQFEVTSQAEWIKFVETKALTPSTVSLSIEANESYDNRTGTVVVKQTNGDLTGTITINQKQTDYLSVTPTSFELTNAEQSITVDIKDNISYSVVIPDDARSWISVQSNTQTKALVDDKVILAIAANSTYEDREAFVTIKQTDGSLAETVKIKQSQTDRLETINDVYNITNEEQQLTIDILSNVDYSVSSDVNWLSVMSDNVSPERFTVHITSNDDFESRTGKLTLFQREGDLTASITINQEKSEPISVTVTEAGTLMSQLDINTYQQIKGLKITGDINGTDVLIIRRMSDLSYLDLSSAHVKAGGSSYFTTDYPKDCFIENDNEIGTCMFYNMKKLKTCIIPNNIIAIRSSSFYNTGLEQFSIPSSVKTIYSSAFTRSNLKEIYIPDSVSLIPNGSEYPFGDNSDTYVFQECFNLQTARIPSHWTAIPYGYFWGCHTLTSINIPEGVTSLEEVCLCQCWALKDVVLPSTLKKIGHGAFYRDAVEIITIPSNVETIEENAFGYCNSLKEVHIKASPETLKKSFYQHLCRGEQKSSYYLCPQRDYPKLYSDAIWGFSEYC